MLAGDGQDASGEGQLCSGSKTAAFACVEMDAIVATVQCAFTVGYGDDVARPIRGVQGPDVCLIRCLRCQVKGAAFQVDNGTLQRSEVFVCRSV